MFHTVINFFSAENIWTQLSVDGEFPGSLQEHTMVGYRDTIFTKVRDLLLRFIIKRISMCRMKEDVIAVDGGLSGLKVAR